MPSGSGITSGAILLNLTSDKLTGNTFFILFTPDEHHMRQRCAARRRRSISTASDQTGGSCGASCRVADVAGNQADVDAFDIGSTIEQDDVATLNAIEAVEQTVRAADDVIAAAEKVFSATRNAASPVAGESRTQQATTTPDIRAGEKSSSATRSRPVDQSRLADTSEFAGQIGVGIVRDVEPAGEPAAQRDSEIGASGINAVLQRIAGSTYEEIDRLIEELRGLRDVLQSGGSRGHHPGVPRMRRSTRAPRPRD
jgi:hypothetical protein